MGRFPARRTPAEPPSGPPGTPGQPRIRRCVRWRNTSATPLSLPDRYGSGHASDRPHPRPRRPRRDHRRRPPCATPAARGPGAPAGGPPAPPDPRRRLPSGSLPHESTLATDFGASRNTVREALDLLRTEGLVDRQPGVGTVVVARKYPHGLDRLMASRKPSTSTAGSPTRSARWVPPGARPRRRPAPRPARRRRALHRTPPPPRRPPLSLDVTYIPWTSAPLCSTATWRTPTSSGSWRPSPAGPRPRRDHPGGGQRGPPFRRRPADAARRGRADAGTPHAPRRRPPRGPGVHPLPRRPHHHERPAAPLP